MADGGPDETTTFTGWVLKDHGAGNGNQVTTGLAVNLGTFQIGPNFLWQKPLVGPIPGDVPAPGRPRNVIDDPFAVRISRETVAGELLSDARSDARDVVLGLGQRHSRRCEARLERGRHVQALSDDHGCGDRQYWRTAGPSSRFRVPRRRGTCGKCGHGSCPACAPDVRAAATIFAGTGEPNGDDTRLIHRYGIDGRITWSRVAFAMFAKFGDWGPYDYHRDFNLTFPVQLMGDVSYTSRSSALVRLAADPHRAARDLAFAG